MSDLENKFGNLLGRIETLTEIQIDITKKKEEILEEAMRVMNEAKENGESWVQPYGS